MQNEIDRCEACRFFLPLNGIDPNNLKAPVAGICRRYPPTVQIMGMQQNMINPKAPGSPIIGRALPQVNGPEWCGEFERIMQPLKSLT